MNTPFSFLKVAALTAGLVLGAPLLAQEAPKVAIYNEQADARADLNLTLAQAQAQKKSVLVVFGANWCGDCVALDRKLHASLQAPVDKRFVVLKVDVGRFNKNLDLASQLGVNLKKGIPAVAVLSAEGSPRGATSGGELADARNMGDDAVLKVLDGLR